MRTRIMCTEFVQEGWVCVTNIKDLFMRNARAWKINLRHVPQKYVIKSSKRLVQNQYF
jgi:hypothetical protein